jgi:hypothetical protein
VPKPANERQSLEHELREELPAQLSACQQELAAGQADKTWRGPRTIQGLAGRGGRDR